jgi:hypothetical protein
MRDGGTDKCLIEIHRSFQSSGFFEEIFAEFVELFYSHPLVWKKSATSVLLINKAGIWSPKSQNQSPKSGKRITNCDYELTKNGNPKSDGGESKIQKLKSKIGCG